MHVSGAMGAEGSSEDPGWVSHVGGCRQLHSWDLCPEPYSRFTLQLRLQEMEWRLRPAQDYMLSLSYCSVASASHRPAQKGGKIDSHLVGRAEKPHC